MGLSQVDQNGLMAHGWGWERFFGESLLTLNVRYMRLIVRSAWFGGLRRPGRLSVSAVLAPVLLLWVGFAVSLTVLMRDSLHGTA